MPKITISTGCLKTYATKLVLDAFNRMGLDKVEFNPWQHMEGRESLDAISAAFSSQDVYVCGILGGWCDFYLAEDEIEAVFENINRQVRLAEILDVSRVRLFYGRAEAEMVTDAIFARFVKNIQTVADKAPKIIFTFENHDGVSADPLFCARVLRAVDRQNVRATFDPINYIRSGFDPFVAWDLLSDFVASIHMKDVRDDKIVGIGEGEFDWSAFLLCVGAQAKDITFTVEYEGEGAPLLGAYCSYHEAQSLLAS